MIPHMLLYFSKFTLTAWCCLLLPFVLAGSVLIIKNHITQAEIRWLSYFFILYAIFRMVLFYNPVTWVVYKKILPPETIDWRHSDVLSCEIGKYVKPRENLRYLAVGSSQTSVIYNEYAKGHQDFAVFALAGLSPLDFYTYRHEIVRQKPKFIILNISEFDLARQPELPSSKWSPFSIRDILELRSVIDTTSYFGPEDKQVINDIFFGKYFPEYKYGFVFKDMADRFFNRNKFFNLAPPTQVNDSLSLKVHLQYLSGLSEKYIPYNIFYLKKVIRFLNQQHIRVIMIEGQYNPLAYQPHNMALNKQVRMILQDFARTDPDNIYLSRDEIPRFDLKDYRDGYHVHAEAGLKYAEILLQELNSKGL
jgi:hypothetical protein